MSKGVLGNTALIWACLRGHVDDVRDLLECDRVDANLRNKAGSNALDIARKCQLFDITSCLEEHDVHYRTRCGMKRKRF